MRFSPGSLKTKSKARRAAHDFAQLVGEVVNCCLSQAPITFGEITDDPEFTGIIAHAPHGFAAPIPLPNGNYLYLFQKLGLRRDEKYLTTLEYRYSYQSAADDPDSWIFRFEYQREPGDDYPYPLAHLHLNAAPSGYTGGTAFSNLHLPTGRVTIEDVARHLITEHGVEAISDDWRTKLAETEAAFREIQAKRFRD